VRHLNSSYTAATAHTNPARQAAPAQLSKPEAVTSPVPPGLKAKTRTAPEPRGIVRGRGSPYNIRMIIVQVFLS
jgi:hypothetical protein